MCIYIYIYTHATSYTSILGMTNIFIMYTSYRSELTDDLEIEIDLVGIENTESVFFLKAFVGDDAACRKRNEHV